MSGTAEYSRHRDHALCGDIFMKTWTREELLWWNCSLQLGQGWLSTSFWNIAVFRPDGGLLYRSVLFTFIDNWAVTLQSVVCTLSKLYLDLAEDTEKKEENTEARRLGGRIKKTAEGRVVLSESPHALFNLPFYWKFLSFMRYFKTALGH